MKEPISVGEDGSWCQDCEWEKVVNNSHMHEPPCSNRSPSGKHTAHTTSWPPLWSLWQHANMVYWLLVAGMITVDNSDRFNCLAFWTHPKWMSVNTNSGSPLCVLPGYHVHPAPDMRMRRRTWDSFETPVRALTSFPNLFHCIQKAGLL